MQYRQMGRSGLRLSTLGVGSYLTIGFKCDQKTSRDTVKVAYDNGINFFDTANAYNTGEGERVLGKCLKDFPRSDLVILSKVFSPVGPGPNDKGLSAKHVFEQCHASLGRLGMDYLDIYMCHRPDPSVPLDETLRALEDLARQGKILYFGVSEWSAAQMVRAQAVAREIGARPISVNEPRYNMLYRYPEQEVFPTTADEGIGNVIFSPLAHGMLTGKYKPGEDAPEGTRASDPDQNSVIMELYWTEENKKKGQELMAIAGDLGVTAAQLAMAWCLKRPEVTSVIMGARSVAQVEENLKAAEIEVFDEVAEKLETLYPPAGDIPTV
ncbi:MAG: aldo/keto reductase family protein [Candidatus Latescibacteria bacterium]|nr:aldo/keto reductase family protein [Candidatus Latescibacterota bacterium]